MNQTPGARAEKMRNSAARPIWRNMAAWTYCVQVWMPSRVTKSSFPFRCSRCRLESVASS